MGKPVKVNCVLFQSIVDAFNGGHQNVHRAEVFLQHSDNNLILFDKNKDMSSPCIENRKLPLVVCYYS